MTKTETDKRFSDAADLHKAIDALCNVATSERQTFVHDRLMSAIDDICQKPGNARAPFNAEQVRIIKEISYRIVYILDPLNKPPRGFINALIREFKDKSAFEKVTSVCGTFAFVITSIYGLTIGGMDLYDKVSSRFQPSAASASPDATHAPIEPKPEKQIDTPPVPQFWKLQK